jgi:hypothetical protein
MQTNFVAQSFHVCFSGTKIKQTFDNIFVHNDIDRIVWAFDVAIKDWYISLCYDRNRIHLSENMAITFCQYASQNYTLNCLTCLDISTLDTLFHILIDVRSDKNALVYMLVGLNRLMSVGTQRATKEFTRNVSNILLFLMKEYFHHTAIRTLVTILLFFHCIRLPHIRKHVLYYLQNNIDTVEYIVKLLVCKIHTNIIRELHITEKQYRDRIMLVVVKLFYDITFYEYILCKDLFVRYYTHTDIKKIEQNMLKQIILSSYNK